MAAVRKVVMESRRCVLARDAEGSQWIGDGTRFYAMDEPFHMNKDNALAILDVDKRQREKCSVMEWVATDPRLSIYPNQETDERLIPALAVKYAGETVLMFVDERREVFAVSLKDLMPIVSRNGYKYALRRRTDAQGNEMRPAVIVMADMFVGGVIMPMSAKATKAIVSAMANVASGEAVEYDDKEDAEFSGTMADE